MRGPGRALLPLLLLFGCGPALDAPDAWLDPPAASPEEDQRTLQVGPWEPDLPLDDDDAAPDDDDSAPLLCEDDHFEDNDAPGQAWPLESGLYPFLVLCDPDHFVLELQQGDTLQVDAGFDGSEGILDLWLIDPTGQPLGGDDERLDGETLELVVEVPGPWILAVELLEEAGEVPGAAYSLSLEVTALECDPGPFEPNDSDLAPWPMGQGSWTDLRVCPFEDDFFAVWLEPGHELLASIDFEEAEGDLDLTLFSPSLTLLDSSAGSAGEETVGAVAGSEGWHVLWVELADDFGPVPGAGYELAIDLP